jgi:hypothetical protein
MAKKKEIPKLYTGQIPWNSAGALGYPESWCSEPVVWKDNVPFEAALRAYYFSRGRSSAKLEFKDDVNEQSYEMFLSDAGDLIKTRGIPKGPIKGWWAFKKNGQNYGIVYLGKVNPYE